LPADRPNPDRLNPDRLNDPARLFRLTARLDRPVRLFYICSFPFSSGQGFV
jgi:hypothetical protein